MEPLRTEAQDCWVLCECSGAGDGVSFVLYGWCNSAGKRAHQVDLLTWRYSSLCMDTGRVYGFSWTHFKQPLFPDVYILNVTLTFGWDIVKGWKSSWLFVFCLVWFWLEELLKLERGLCGKSPGLHINNPFDARGWDRVPTVRGVEAPVGRTDADVGACWRAALVASSVASLWRNS